MGHWGMGGAALSMQAGRPAGQGAGALCRPRSRYTGLQHSPLDGRAPAGYPGSMSKPPQPLYALRGKDVPEAAAVLKDAFSRDPLWNRLFAGEPGRERKLQDFFEVPVLYCLRYGRVYAPSAALEGIAAWLPGERADMRIGGFLRSGALRAGLRLGLSFGRRLERIFAGAIRDRREHMRGKRYLYLLVLGVRTAQQGRGFGGLLLRSLIEGSERQGLHLYLETETERNLRFYERFGFRTLKALQLPVIDLPSWQMARAPSASR
jgi:ribosomal protein S18 acetylase RimI-like enzyme